MAQGNWLDDLIPKFILLCKGENHSRFQRAQVLNVLKILADREKGKPQHKREGFFHISTYADSGLTKFLGRIENEWNKIPGPIMSSAIQTPPKDSAYALECVLAVELDKDGYDPDAIHKIMKDFLIQYVPGPFECLVVQVAKVSGAWYDLHVRYSNNLLDNYKLLTGIPWVKDCVVKPLSDFGRLTLAQIK